MQYQKTTLLIKLNSIMNNAAWLIENLEQSPELEVTFEQREFISVFGNLFYQIVRDIVSRNCDIIRNRRL